MWNLYNGRKRPGEHFRVFPLSNWTELDVWQYIEAERIALPELYFSHEREVFERDGLLVPTVAVRPAAPSERWCTAPGGFRTLGDAVCTGAVEVDRRDGRRVIDETAASRTTERGGRLDDRRSDTAMEDRKRDGYF